MLSLAYVRSNRVGELLVIPPTNVFAHLLSVKMGQVTYPGPPLLFHIRINALFVTMTIIDASMFLFAVESTLANGVGGMVLFATEVRVFL